MSDKPSSELYEEFLPVKRILSGALWFSHVTTGSLDNRDSK